MGDHPLRLRPRRAGGSARLTVSSGARPAGPHGVAAVRDAIARTITTLPERLRRSLTWDQGAELAKHDDLRIDTGRPVYICDPRSPWQRGTNENTNGLLRQCSPKGSDRGAHDADERVAVASAPNAQPRKTLDWRTEPSRRRAAAPWIRRASGQFLPAVGGMATAQPPASPRHGRGASPAAGWPAGPPETRSSGAPPRMP